jgi:hypothetical protein
MTCHIINLSWQPMLNLRIKKYKKNKEKKRRRKRTELLVVTEGGGGFDQFPG